MLNQAENKIKIEGILSETDIKYGSYVKNGETVETIGGIIKVLIEQNINGKDEVLEVPVHTFAGKYTKNKTINPSYESLEKVMKEYVSIAACGAKERADKIRITNASMRMNEFYNQNGQLVSQPRIYASFISRAIGEFKPEATFSMEFMVSNINRVVDSEGIELDPAKLEVTVIVPQYGGKVDVCKLNATNPNVINAVEGYWEPGNCYKANGRLNFSSTTQVFKQEVDFGEPIEQVRTINLNEFIITGGSQSPLEGEYAFDIDDIKTAMAERKNHLEEMKTKGITKKAPAPASTTSKGELDLGF